MHLFQEAIAHRFVLGRKEAWGGLSVRLKLKLVRSLSWETDPGRQGRVYCMSPTGPSAVAPEMSTSCPVPGAAVFQA